MNPKYLKYLVLTLPWVVMLLFALSSVWLWFDPQRDPIRVTEIPYIAVESPLIKGAITEPALLEIMVLRLSKEQKARLESKLSAPLPSGELLAVVESKKMPYGSTLIASRNPESKKTEITVYPKKAPKLEFLPLREAALWMYQDQTFDLEFQPGSFRVLDLHLKAKVAIRDIGKGSEKVKVGVGVAYRF